jgi:sugar lactone lactonase YvrE
MTLPLGRLAALGLGLAALALPATAAADTVSETYSVPGTYTLTIPQYTTSVNVIANGAGGTDATGGGSSGANGAGGVGAQVNETVPVGPGTPFAPGDTLTVIVGARGGGGHGGSGSELGGAGGDGGGLALVADTTGTPTGLAIAGGGGGGGGRGGIDGDNGGAGGQGPGRDASGAAGTGLGHGSGGRVGDDCGSASRGAAGGSAGLATDAGGGGGGGDGACGGAGGSAGGAGGGGGGGGGAGASFMAPSGVGTIGLSAFNHDASVTLHFTRRDVAPQITSAASASVPLSAGTVRIPVSANGAPASRFSLGGAPAWLSIDPATGVITGTIPPLTAGRFTFTISADNGVGAPATQAFTLEVTGPPVVLTPSPPLRGNVGLPLSGTLAAHGGAGPITWTVAGGQLPPGLVLASNGQFGGTPTQTGSFTFTARAADSAAPAADSATEPVTVIVSPRVLAVSTTSLPPTVVGAGYEQSLSAVMNAGRLTWSVAGGSLPPGLSLLPVGKIVGTPTTPGTYSFTLRVADSSMTATAKLTLVVGPRVQAAVYVVNGANSAVHSFSLDANGNSAPLTSLAGSATGLNGTSAVTIAPDGRTYVASANSNQIAEYPYGASGNVKPDTVIGGADTGLASPQALALDGAGRLYVANAAASTISVYAAGASGDAKPVAVIGGPHTGLATPQGLTFDLAGHLWVADTSANRLSEYPAGANGDVAPLDTIAGFATRLNGPQGIVLDGTGNLLVADTYDNSITEYQPSASGNVLPIRRIAGSNTGLSFPVGIDVDAAGNVWVSNQFGGVEAFTFPSNGNRTPFADITGPATGLAAPGRLAVAPPLSVRTARLPRARAGRRYAATLRANLGTTPYRWRVRSLPRGLRLRAGRIVGRPRHAGTYRIGVRVSDASHPVMRAQRRLTLKVAP